MIGPKVTYVSAGWLEPKSVEDRNCVCCILCDCDFVAPCTTDKLMCGWIQLVSTSSYKQIQCYKCSLGNFENPKFSARYLDLSSLYISFKFPRTIPFCVCVFMSFLVLLSSYLHANLTDDLEPFDHTCFCYHCTRFVCVRAFTCARVCVWVGGQNSFLFKADFFLTLKLLTLNSFSRNSNHQLIGKTIFFSNIQTANFDMTSSLVK